MASKLLEFKLMLRHLVRYNRLENNTHIFTAGDKAVEGSFERMTQYNSTGDVDNAILWLCIMILTDSIS